MPSPYTVSPLSLDTPISDVVMNGTLASGDLFPNDGLTFLYYKNTSTTVTATVKVNSVATGVSPAGYGNVPITDTAISIAPSTSVLVGPFGPSRYNNASGMASVNYTNQGTILSVKAVRFTPIA